MSNAPRWQLIVTAVGTALALAACGGGGGGGDSSTPVGGGTVTPPVTPVAPVTPPVTPVTPTNPVTPTDPVTPADPNAPILVGNIAADGRAWINYRRTQIGVPTLAENAQINIAAQGHSDYQRINAVMSHTQVAGREGVTGINLSDRLTAAGYTLSGAGYGFGEVISGATNRTGFFMVDELITAIYHRFVIFEPMFREIGTGAATNTASYSYFTANLATRNGFGTGITPNTVVTWPYNGQTQVTTNFFSDTESPDPVPNVNEVGYPISVHANLNAPVVVATFTVRPRGGAALDVLRVDPITTGAKTAASIIPLKPLAAATTYDVNFAGTVNGAIVMRDWSFTTK